MYSIGIADILPGHRTARPVYAQNGLLLVPEDTFLTPWLVDKLRAWGIGKVMVKQQRHNRPHCLAEMDYTAQRRAYEEVLRKARFIFSYARRHGRIPLPEINAAVDCILHSILASPLISPLLHRHFAGRDEYTYHHSVNVGVLTGLIATWLGFTRLEVRQAVAAGLLHDVGKFYVPLAVLHKPGPLTDEEFSLIKQHPYFSYRILQKNLWCPRVMLQAVLQHHERYDGQGYPGMLPAEAINKYARVISTADAYDAMVSQRVYRPRFTPYRAAAELLACRGKQFDPTVAAVFVAKLRVFFCGDIVELSDGRQGKIINVPAQAPDRPLVETRTGLVDLAWEQDVSIKRVLSYGMVMDAASRAEA